jgi:hypothetical protein
MLKNEMPADERNRYFGKLIRVFFLRQENTALEP